ncbi:MAG: hypothetical protein NTW49_08840 [Bacteroidia bacterium]|nr:hypothetical protein [Bacteroidia bacterium]
MSELFHIGNITSGYRPIKKGDRFDQLFPKPEDKDRIMIRDGDADKTVDLMKQVAWKYKADTEKLAPQLKASSLRQTCDNIWDFLYNHIQYRLDKKGMEQLRRPARSWQERSLGIDCDCFSIFVSTILLNLQIPHTFRITKYDQNTWQHVYVVVPIPESGSYYTIDCVLSRFNYEKPYSQKKDFPMNINSGSAHLAGIDIAVLSGTGDDTMFNDVVFARDLEGINNIGDTSEEERLKAIYSYLVKNRKLVASNPKMIASVDYPPAFIQMLDYAIGAWNTPNRDKALENLAKNEDDWNKKNGLSQTDENLDLSGLDDDWQELDGLSGAELASSLGSLKKKLKGFFNKVGEAVKKGGQAFIRFNPASIAVRSAYLLAMKLDIGSMASKLKWGYATEQQAKAKRISSEDWKKSKSALDKVEKMFADKLQGQRSKLRSAILNGKAKGISGTGNLGFVLAASVAAASPLIILTLKVLADSGLVHKDAANNVINDLQSQSQTPGTEPAKTTGDNPSSTDPGKPADLPAESSTDSQATSEQEIGKTGSFLKPLLIIGAAGLGIWGISSLVKKGKKKPSLSGVEKTRKNLKESHKKSEKIIKSVTLK